MALIRIIDEGGLATTVELDTGERAASALEQVLGRGDGPPENVKRIMGDVDPIAATAAAFGITVEQLRARLAGQPEESDDAGPDFDFDDLEEEDEPEPIAAEAPKLAALPQAGYPCSQCDFVAGSGSGLAAHVRAKHED